jgi:hypothetical protein
MEIDTLTTLNDQSSQELRGAVAAITAGDETATRYAAEVRQLVDGVNSASRQAAADAARLHADDVMNPDGKRRLLSELPGKLVADTRDQLDKAEIALDIVEGRHIERILHHDSRNDGALVAELQNYTANLKPAGAVAAIVQLAANARYSTILAGPMGASLAARFNFHPLQDGAGIPVRQRQRGPGPAVGRAGGRYSRGPAVDRAGARWA